MMGFGEAVALFYKNYVNFEGRSSRAEYWWTVLFQGLVYGALFIGVIVLSGTVGGELTSGSGVILSLLLLSGGLFWLVNFLPGIAIKIRRFHDLDQTGWLVLVFVIANAIIGLSAIAQIIWYAMPGTPGRNQYGPNPYENEADIFR